MTDKFAQVANEVMCFIGLILLIAASCCFGAFIITATWGLYQYLVHDTVTSTLAVWVFGSYGWFLLTGFCTVVFFILYDLVVRRISDHLISFK